MNDRIIDNPLYQGMSLKSLLETTDLFQIPGLLLDENGGSKDATKKKDGSDMYQPTAAFLGPNIWDNTQKMSLEYMDLDEFLNENNIPLDVCMSPGESDQEQQQQQEEEQCVSPISSSEQGLGMVIGGCPSPLRGSLSPQLSSDEDSMQFINPVTVERREREIDSPEPNKSLPESPKISSIMTQNSSTTLSTTPTTNSNFVIKVMSKPSSAPLSSVPKVIPSQKIVDVNFTLAESDLALATVPGIDFDPRKRAFTDEELKPQPMIKKSRKQYVPEDQKDEHYWQRRNKNNYAAKRSREARRMKENQIAMRANYLEKENAALTLELTKYKTELSILKKRLALYEKPT